MSITRKGNRLTMGDPIDEMEAKQSKSEAKLLIGSQQRP